jgi:hypothetical protein
MEKPVKSPIDQLKDISDDVDEGWRDVQSSLKQATFEYLPDISDEDRQMLEESFWSAHVEILKRAELYHPGIAEKIITRAVEISEQRRDAEIYELENVTLPRLRRRAWLRAIIGLPQDLKEV